MYPKLSCMVFNYFSVPGMCIQNIIIVILMNQIATSTADKHLFSQGCQLLHLTHSHLSPAIIHSFLCFGNRSHKDLVDMPDVALVIHNSHEQKWPHEGITCGLRYGLLGLPWCLYTTVYNIHHGLKLQLWM